MLLRFGELKQYYESLIFLISYGTIENTKSIILLSIKLSKSQWSIGKNGFFVILEN